MQLCIEINEDEALAALAAITTTLGHWGTADETVADQLRGVSNALSDALQIGSTVAMDLAQERNTHPDEDTQRDLVRLSLKRAGTRGVSRWAGTLRGRALDLRRQAEDGHHTARNVVELSRYAEQLALMLQEVIIEGNL